MQFKNLGNLFDGSITGGEFASVFNGQFKGKHSITDMDNLMIESFKNQMRIGTDGISEYTMAQIKAKAAALDLTEALTIETLGIANDADFKAKAATGTLTWGKALNSNVTDISTLGEALLNSKKISKEAQETLSDIGKKYGKDSEYFKNYTRSIIDGSSDFGDISNELIDISTSVQSSGSSLSNYFKGLYASIKPLIPVMAGLTAAYAAFKAVDYLTHDYTRASEYAATTAEEYSNAQTELQNLNAQYDEQKQRIEELNELKANGTITMSQEVELENLQNQNTELERQLSLQKSIVETKQQASASAAKEAADTEMSYMEAMQEKYGTVKGWFLGAAGYLGSYQDADGYTTNAALEWDNEHKGDTTLQGQIDVNIEKLGEYNEQLTEVQDKLSKDPTNEGFLKQQTDLQEKILGVKEELQSEAETLQEWIDQSTDSNGNITKGYESYVDGLRDTLNEINNIGKSQKEIDFNNLDTFFSSSSSSLIKDRLEDIVKSSGSAKDALEEFQNLGLSLDDINVSEEGFIRYFDDLKKAADEASDAVNKVNNNLTMDDIGDAFESKNAGDDYVSLNDYLKQAKELFDQGLTGTDDFKSVAEAISYGIDSSAESFAANYQKLQRYFTEDDDGNLTGAGINNFLTDLQNLNKGYAEWDANAQKWNINMDNTAQAAKEMGISVQSMEAILGRIKDYDNLGEFDFHSAIDDFNSAKAAIEGIDNLLDNMSSGDKKKALESQLEGWKSQMDGWENDLASLDTDIVMKINLEYDLASIQAEIDEVKDLIDGGDDSVHNYANLISGNNKYIDTAEQGLGFGVEGVEIPVDYVANKDTITTLKENLKNITSEEDKIEIQAEIANLQDLQIQLLNAFSNAHPEINADSSMDEINAAWNDFVSSTEGQEIIADIKADNSDAINKLADIFGIAPEDIVIGITANDQASGVIDEINKKELIAKTAPLMSEDHATGALYLWNSLSMDPKFTSMTAVDQASYVIDVWNSLTPIQKTAVLEVADQGATTTAENVKGAVDQVPPSAETTISATDLATGVINSALATLNAANGRTAHTYVYTHNITTNEGKAGSGKASGTMLSPAHASGTAYNVMNTVPAYANGKVSLSKDEDALVNEMGTESLIRDGQWLLLPGGMHVESLKKGDIVLNASQTDSLLKYGKAAGRGKAYANGTVGSVRDLAKHSLVANAYAGGASGSFNFSGGASVYNPPGSGTSIDQAADNLSDAAEATSEAAEKLSDSLSGYTDWIERVFKNMETSFDHIQAQMERIAHLPDKQVKMYELMSKNKEYMGNTQAAMTRYQEHLNSLQSQMGLNPLIYEQIKHGSFDISKYDDETQKLISEYQEYYDKLRDCTAQYDELIAKQAELAQDALSNITNYYDMMNGVDEAAMGFLEAERELWTNQGKNATSSDQYSSIRNSMAQEQKVSDRLQQQVTDYENEIEKLISNGFMERYSEEYFAAHEELNGLKKALFESQSALIDFEDQLRELDYTKLQNTIDSLERTATLLENKESLTESKGEQVSESELKQQMDVADKQIQALYNKINQKQAEQAKYDVGSERYNDIAEEISDMKSDVFGLMENIEELKNKIWEVRWQPFFDGQEALGDLITETDDLRNLLNDDAFIDTTTGGITTDGIAALALMSQSMNAAKQQVRDYQEALKKLDEDLKNGNISTSEYEEQQKEFLSSIRDSVSAVEDYKNQIIDLWKEQLTAENDVIQNSIDKHKELLDIKKKNDDYSKNIKSQTKEINVIKAQMAALSGVNYLPDFY